MSTVLRERTQVNRTSHSEREVRYSNSAYSNTSRDTVHGRATETYYRRMREDEIDPSLRLLKQNTRDSVNIARTSGRISPSMNMERGEYMNSFNFDKERESRPLFLDSLRTGEPVEYTYGNVATVVAPEEVPQHTQEPTKQPKRRIRVIPGDKPAQRANPLIKLVLSLGIIFCAVTIFLGVAVGLVADNYVIQTMEMQSEIAEIRESTQKLNVSYTLALSEIKSMLMEEGAILTGEANLHTPYTYQVNSVTPDRLDYTVVSDTYSAETSDAGTFGSQLRVFATNLWSLLTE